MSIADPAAMKDSISYFLNRVESQRVRTRALKSLRSLVALPPERDLREDQWEALESQLTSVSNRLVHRLRTHTDRFLADRHNAQVRELLVQGLGEIELEITQSYMFFDTFMDVLTQRLSRPVGDLLLGCDVLAADGLKRGFLADITVLPVVYCDRGFGASTCREGVSITPGVPNPIPIIAIPYARLVEKYNLMSIYHEVGHQALNKLNLVKSVQQLFEEQMTKAGAPPLIGSLFARWSKELTPDFWAFCLTGMSQTCSMREILALPQEMTSQISATQPHPPAFLRFLTSVYWCRHLWGKGIWDEWEHHWHEAYPIAQVEATTRQILETALRYLPVAARIMIETRFAKLGNKPLTSLFNLDDLQPVRLQSLASTEAVSSPDFRRKPVGVQLAAFRLLREKRTGKLSELDTLMTQWITQLPNHSLNQKN